MSTVICNGKNCFKSNACCSTHLHLHLLTGERCHSHDVLPSHCATISSIIAQPFAHSSCFFPQPSSPKLHSRRSFNLHGRFVNYGTTAPGPTDITRRSSRVGQCSAATIYMILTKLGPKSLPLLWNRLLLTTTSTL